MITPQEVFEKRYAGRTNNVTPVVLKYGWVVPGLIAYEVSTNYKAWALVVVVYYPATQSTREIRGARFFTEDEQEMGQRIVDIERVGRSVHSEEVGRSLKEA